MPHSSESNARRRALYQELRAQGLPRRLAGHATSEKTAEKRRKEFYSSPITKINELPSPKQRDQIRADKFGVAIPELRYFSHSYSDWYAKVKVRYTDDSHHKLTRWTTVTIKRPQTPTNGDIIAALALSDVASRYQVEILSVDIHSIDHVSDHTVSPY